MSADLMLVNYETEEYFEGSKSQNCVCVDETSGGNPHTEFGKLLSMCEREEIDAHMIERVKVWYEYLEHKETIFLEHIVKWLEDHIGSTLRFERW